MKVLNYSELKKPLDIRGFFFKDFKDCPYYAIINNN
jgi:hypothetical protein